MCPPWELADLDDRPASASAPVRRPAIPSTDTSIDPAEFNHLYTLKYRDQSDEVKGRDQAIEEAKTISTDSGTKVRLERDDRRVHMLFRDGELVEYRFDTGHRG